MACHTLACQYVSCSGDTLANSAHQIDRDQLSRGERWQCRTNVFLKCARDISRRRRRKSRRTWTVIKALARRVGGAGGGWWTQTDGWTDTKARAMD